MKGIYKDGKIANLPAIGFNCPDGSEVEYDERYENQVEINVDMGVAWEECSNKEYELEDPQYRRIVAVPANPAPTDDKESATSLHEAAEDSADKYVEDHNEVIKILVREADFNKDTLSQLSFADYYEGFLAGAAYKADAEVKELHQEINRLRELLRVTNAPLMWLSTLDKMPTLPLLDREGVINFVVKTAKGKVIGPDHNDWGTLLDRLPSSLSSNDDLKAEVKQLREALAHAVDVIKQWHNADDVWDIYYNHAPEMKQIKAALSGQQKHK